MSLTSRTVMYSRILVHVKGKQPTPNSFISLPLLDKVRLFWIPCLPTDDNS